MKTHRKFATFLAAVGCTALTASATTFYWDGSTDVALGSSDNANTASQAWLSGGFWDNNTTSAALASWTSGDSAVFGGSAASQTVTLGSTISVGNLTFGSGADGSGTSGTAYTISGGTLTLNSTALAVNTGTVITSAISNAGTATISGAGALTLRGNISGAGTLTHSGAGLLTLSAADGGRDIFNALSGAGSIRVGASAGNFYGLFGSLSGLTGTVTVAGLVHNRASALGSATAAFSQEASSVWLFSNDDLANLNVTYHMGSLSGSGTLAGTGYTGTRSGTKTLSIGALNTDTIYSGTIVNGYAGGGGTVALTKVGTGKLTLAGGNSYTSGTTLSTGTIIATNGNALGTGGTVTINDANTGSSNTSLLLGNVTMGRAITVANQGSGTTTLGANGSVANPEFSGAITLAKDVTLDGSTNTDRLTFTGGIGGTGNVTISGTTGRVMFLTGANTFNGSLTINNGSVLQLDYGTSNATSYIPDASVVTVNGTLKFAKGNNSETIGGLSGSGTVRGHEGVTNIASALEISGGASKNFSGVLENGGAAGSTLSLTKSGAGTQTLSGANTYTGGTTIQNGTLVIGGASGTLATQALTIGNSTNSGILVLGDSSNAKSLTFSSLNTSGIGTANAIVAGGNATASSLTINTATTGTYAGVFGGAGTNQNLINLTKSGAGALTLSGGGAVANLYPDAGTLAISGGAFNVNVMFGNSDYGTAHTSIVNQTGGTVTLGSGANYYGGRSNNQAITYNLSAGTFDASAGSFWLGWDGGANPTFNVSGTGSLKVAGLNQANTGTTGGTLNLTGGQITIGSGGIGNNKYVFNTLNFGGGTIASSAAFSGNAGQAITLTGTNGATIFDTTGGNITLNGVLGGAGGLTKSGSGTLTLTGANSYSGGTTVNAGADLRINGEQTGAGTVTVAATGKLGGSGSVIGGINVSGVLAPGNSIESLGGGALSFTTSSTYAYELQTNLYAGSPGVAGDLAYASGTLNIAGITTLTLADLATSTVLANGSKLTLISYVGGGPGLGWNGGLFSYDPEGPTGLVDLLDDSKFTLGANQWLFNYNDTSGGVNYTGNTTGATGFVTMTVVPESNVAALIGGFGMLALLRRRRLK